jgi:hypothetical protein
LNLELATSLRFSKYTVPRLLSLVFISISSYAQLDIVPIQRVHSNNKTINARTESLTPIALPFWDDFSVTISKGYYPNNQRWENSESVWVNSGVGIHSPSLNVATFDGYDSLGKPYSLNAILAKGFADKLTSAPLKLGDVAASDRATVYISFFYQFTGNGDPPEPGDALSLWFKNNKGQWIVKWSIENNGNLKPDEFIQIILPLSGDEFFHNDFQFRFQNFGRLSGPYDTWNIDYLYVNKGRTSADTSFPDRSITTVLTTLFSGYYSVPYRHLFQNPNVLSKPSFDAYNLSIGNQQPINHFSSAEILSFQKKNLMDTRALSLDNAVSDGSLTGGQRKTISLVNLPTIADLTQGADSVLIKIKASLTTKDNLPLSNNGDYNPIIYSPIDFRSNDTIFTTYTSSTYYAYDDGIAEYGANITGSGTQLAYQFDMKTTQADTIVAVDLFFPKFGDDSNHTINLHIIGSIDGSQTSYLFQQNVTVQRKNRNTENVFMRVSMPVGVPVKTKFYVGWKLNTSAAIPIGLDSNNDSGNKIFVNSKGVWEQNLILKGSLMIRPVFGHAQSTITAVEDLAMQRPYPNPTQRNFYLPPSAQQIQVYNSSGSVVSIEETEHFNRKEITLLNPSRGLYVVRYYDHSWHTEKIMVQP